MKANKIFIVLIILAILVVVTLVMPADNSKIYSHVFSQLVTKDDTYGGNLKPRKVYASKKIINYPDAIIYPNQDLKVQVPEDIQNAISKKAKSMNIELLWINSPDSISYNELGEVVGGGVVIVFGELQQSLIFSDISSTILVANLASGGTEYNFIKLLNMWFFLNSEVSWIS